MHAAKLQDPVHHLSHRVKRALLPLGLLVGGGLMAVAVASLAHGWLGCPALLPALLIIAPKPGCSTPASNRGATPLPQTFFCFSPVTNHAPRAPPG